MRLRTTLAALFCGLAAFVAPSAIHASAFRTITDYTLVSANDFPDRDPKDWRLLGSNDGKNWTVVDSRTNEFFAERFEKRIFSVTNRIPFSTFRLVIDSVRQRATSAQIAEIRLNGLIDESAEVMDVTPGVGDLVTVHGENAPAEGRRRAFDGDLQTKWLDFITDLQSQPLTWIQWEYEAQEAAGGDFMQSLSTVLEVRQKSRILALNTYRVSLDGTIIWAGPEQDLIAFQDSSGAALLQLGQPEPGLRAGQHITIKADSELKSEGLAISIARSPVVINDGIHTAREVSGRVYLEKGRHPISLEWFQAEGEKDLSTEYEGPGISKQPIPDSVLWHRQGAGPAGRERWEPGLEYKAYEGRWSVLPAFSELRPVKRGVFPNFSIAARSRDSEAGLVFNGWIDIGAAGWYTFYTSSDDGSRLLIRDPHAALKVRGEGTLPSLRRIEPGRIFASIDENRWIVADGKVTFRGQRDAGYDVEITAESGRMILRIARLNQEFPSYLLNSRIRAEGISRPTYGADRLRRGGEMIVPSLDQIQVVEFPAAGWRNYPLTTSDSLGARTNEPAHLRGEVRQEGGRMFLRDSSGDVEIEPSQIGFNGFSGRADVLGCPVLKGTNRVLAFAVFAALGDGTEKSAQGLPLLTTIEEIHALSREEAARSYPVKIRGVVTAAWPGVESAIIQDGTRGIFVPDLTVSPSDYPEIGDYMEVEGTTDPGGFAPVINTESVSRIGRGTMPEPQQPTWNQLVNGSMDVQYCELRGLVTSVRDDLVTLLMRGGWIDVQVNGISRARIASYEHALIRMRGAIGSSWDGTTHQLTNAQIKIERPIISIDQPAPRDIFDTRLRHAGDLLMFDPARDDLQRLKVSGQIVHAGDGEYFLMDGTNGLRFFPKKQMGLRTGDLVEVVGYPRPAFGAPVLRDAEARVSGHAPLTPPARLDESSMFLRYNDATRVALEARLAGIRSSRTDEILELQAGTRTVFALIKGAGGEPGLHLPIGATVYVPGVYDGRGSERGDRVELDSFELLCDSPADIRILKRPAWWTSERMIALIGSLAGILLAAVIWIRALRRHVGRQTRALTDEVDERRAAEQAAHRARREAELAREAAEAGNRAKGQFLAAMSHEIRTPMNAIIGMANLLMDSGLNSDQAELARTVSSSGQALLTIMNDILDFSKIEAGKIVLDSTAFNLREVLEATLDLLAEPAQRKGVELTCILEKDVCTGVKGDPGRLRQILLNLLSNAVKFTDQGEVAVRVSQLPAPMADDGKVRLKMTVRDTGIGISPEARQRIFSPFEQADKSTTRKYGGTGLGLAICRPLAELMGGRIEVSSEPGQGSEFVLTVCLERAVTQAELPAASSIAGMRILLCEPHPSAREMIGGLLSAIGVRAGIHTGNEAALQQELQAAAQSGDPYQAVILDVGADSKERLALLRQLRTSISTDFKIVLLTPISQRFSGNELLAKGVEAAVAKPVKLGALRDALLKALSAPAPKPAAAQKAAEKLELKQARILLAEDNPVNQMVALRQLKKLGYAAEVVSNGAEAVASFERQHFDYILMDCHMPEMDGYEATKRIRELAKRNGRVRIVAMTANAMQGDRERCLEAGMDDYISKPVAIEQLKAALEK